MELPSVDQVLGILAQMLAISAIVGGVLRWALDRSLDKRFFNIDQKLSAITRDNDDFKEEVRRHNELIESHSKEITQLEISKLQSEWDRKNMRDELQRQRGEVQSIIELMREHIEEERELYTEFKLLRQRLNDEDTRAASQMRMAGSVDKLTNAVGDVARAVKESKRA